MISITDKYKCCGCNACGDICAHNAISFERDSEGFLYPHIDEKLCTNCGLCEQVCPELHVDELRHNDMEKPTCFAVNNKNIETRFNSTSGGAFSALAEEMYKRGGYVGGAIYRENWEVKHFISNNPEDLQRIRQSKYSQSDAIGFYKKVCELLKNGEQVLVCGTPCQMAALRRFLRKEYENLIVVDFICKYIGSPLFTEKYLDYLQRIYGSSITYYKHKDKERGWRSLSKRIDFKNGKSIYAGPQDNDIASLAFHSNLIGRPSCYECPFKDFPRMSDITLGDFWGCENYEQYRELDDNIGTSIVMCNSRKGIEYFALIQESVNSIQAQIEHVIPGNKHLLEPAPTCNDRNDFFRDLQNGNIEEVVNQYCSSRNQKSKPLTWKRKLKVIYKTLRTQWQIGEKSLVCLFAFIKWNFFSKQVNIDFNQGAFLFVGRKSCITIHKSAQINLQASFHVYSYSIVRILENAVMDVMGPVELGKKSRFPESQLESRLLLDKGAHYTNRKDTHWGYGSNVEVHANAVLDVEHCGTNINCTVICAKQITMKGNVAIGRDVEIRDTNAHQIALDGYKIARPILIEDHVWLCSGSTICPGVKVHTGAIVGTNSVVVQSVPAHTLVGGYPAKVIEHNIAWKL